MNAKRWWEIAKPNVLDFAVAQGSTSENFGERDGVGGVSGGDPRWRRVRKPERARA